MHLLVMSLLGREVVIVDSLWRVFRRLHHLSEGALDLLWSGVWFLSIVNEFVLGVEEDLVLLFLNDVHGAEHIQCIIHSTLHIFEINLI